MDTVLRTSDMFDIPREANLQVGLLVLWTAATYPEPQLCSEGRDDLQQIWLCFIKYNALGNSAPIYIFMVALFFLHPVLKKMYIYEQKYCLFHLIKHCVIFSSRMIHILLICKSRSGGHDLVCGL